MFIKLKKAQSTLEYTLLIAALILGFIYAANTVFRGKVKDQADAGGKMLDKATTEITSAMGGS